MGAEIFYARAHGKTANEAFWAEVEDAQRCHGYDGYTGTIAEKGEFIMIPMPAGEDPVKFANRLIDAQDERIDDKWGPAGCIQIRKNDWLFFGWASA